MSTGNGASSSKTSTTKPYSLRNKVETCEVSGESLKKNEVQVPSAGGLGEYITAAYGILRLVFSYLPMKDLRTAAQVCKAWKEAAEHEEVKRKNIDWSFWMKTKDCTSLDLLNFAFRRETFCAPQVCLSFLRGRGIEPHFKCGSSKFSCPYSRRKVCRGTHCVCQYVQKVVHPASCCILMEAGGVIGTTTNMDCAEEVEKGRCCVSTLLLPKVADVNINTFYVDMGTLSKLRQVEFCTKEMSSLLGVNPDVSPIRCVLLFCNSEYHDEISDFVENLARLQSQRFVIGGGLFKNFHFVTNDEKNCSKKGAIVGIAFSGDNMQCASTIVEPEVDCQAQVASLMDELRSCNLPEKNSVALMFACCGRGEFHYRSQNLESSVFRSYFPNTPILGAFVQGEIGRKFLSGDREDFGAGSMKRARISESEDLLHSYTSVIVYLAFGTNKSQNKQ